MPAIEYLSHAHVALHDRKLLGLTRCQGTAADGTTMSNHRARLRTPFNSRNTYIVFFFRAASLHSAS